MNYSAQLAVLSRITEALEAARTTLAPFTPGQVAAEYKSGHDPVTEADRAVDAVLRKILLQPGEGWLSEESVDDLVRLDHKHVWVVDPLDGTREFVEGIPEWCVSIGLVENGQPVAGGICNPATNEIFVGSLETGVTYNGKLAGPTQKDTLDGAVILASRSEMKRGEWEAFKNTRLEVRAMGSVAYKLARVSAGLADATWTLVPKHEWDVAAGVALVLSAGGFARRLDGAALTFNNRKPKFPGMYAAGKGLEKQLDELIEASQREKARTE